MPVTDASAYKERTCLDSFRGISSWCVLVWTETGVDETVRGVSSRLRMEV